MDHILQSENILTIADIHKLHVSLFMYDYHHNTLPKSFEQYTPSNNLATITSITRQHNLLRTENQELTFLLNYIDIILENYGITMIITLKISIPDISSNMYYLNSIYLTILKKYIA